MSVQHARTVRFKAPANAPTIELDPVEMVWYIRFSRAKVVKTISEEAPGSLYAIDLDANNQVIGFELLGVKEFSLSSLRKLPFVDTSKVDIEGAKFVPAACRDKVEA